MERASLDLRTLPARAPGSGHIQVVIEASRESRVKYKVDPATGLIAFDKLLPTGFRFPFNFGSIPSTKAPDGDPLDVVVLLDEPLVPGSVVNVRLVGIIEAEQEQDGRTERNDRLIAVALRPGGEEESPGEPVERVFPAVENFFVAYNEAQGRVFRPLGCHGREHAEAAVQKAIEGPSARPTPGHD